MHVLKNCTTSGKTDIGINLKI